MNPQQHPLPIILQELGYTIIKEGWDKVIEGHYGYRVKGPNPYWHRIGWWQEQPHHLVLTAPDKWIKLEEPNSIQQLQEELDRRTQYPDCLDNEGNKQYRKTHGHWPTHTYMKPPT